MTSEYTTTEYLLYTNIEMLSILSKKIESIECSQTLTPRTHLIFKEKRVDRMFTNPDSQNTFKGFFVIDFHEIWHTTCFVANRSIWCFKSEGNTLSFSNIKLCLAKIMTYLKTQFLDRLGFELCLYSLNFCDIAKLPGIT